MRGEYAAIHAALPDDPEFQSLGPSARLCWFTLRLVLGPSGIDLLRAHRVVLAPMTGLPEDAIEPALQELEAGHWLVRDRDTLWLRNALRYNPHMNVEANQKHREGVVKHLAGLPRLPIVAKFAQYYNLPMPFEIPEDSHTDSHPDGYGIQVSVSDTGHRTPDTGKNAAPTARDSNNGWTGADVVDAWITYGRSVGWPDPPKASRSKQGAAGKRIAQNHTREEILRAMIGIGTLFPHSPPKSQPWDLFTLERKFTEAHAAAQNHPKVKAAEARRRFMEAG